jgi:molybdopterin synthase catalytic subunit
MKVLFQSKNFKVGKILDDFSSKNIQSGSIISFLGKVREFSNQKKLRSMDIELYEKMAKHQTHRAINSLFEKIQIEDLLIIHRYGNLKPGENIIFILVASKHRTEGFKFIQEMVIFFKKKITFWKKENFPNISQWVKEQK